jgi:hypothetical protein
MRNETKSVIVFSMRRSGSTAFWECFRHSGHYLALDEPFNPLLRELPQEHPKGTRAEFIDIYSKSPSNFKANFAPIDSEGETHTKLTYQQVNYLKWLSSQSDKPLFIDVTRCNAKMEHMIDEFNDSVFIYLYRNAHRVARSHLVPSGRRDLLGVRRYLKEILKFSRYVKFNGWQYEEILKGAYSKEVPDLFSSVDIKYNKKDPAYIFLLKYWLLNYRSAIKASKYAASQDIPFYMINFDAFCKKPGEYLQSHAANWLAKPLAYLDTANLKLPSKYGEKEMAVWMSGGLDVGFSNLELNWL